MAISFKERFPERHKAEQKLLRALIKKIDAAITAAEDDAEVVYCIIERPSMRIIKQIVAAYKAGWDEVIFDWYDVDKEEAHLYDKEETHIRLRLK